MVERNLKTLSREKTVYHLNLLAERLFREKAKKEGKSIREINRAIEKLDHIRILREDMLQRQTEKQERERKETL